MKEDGKQSGNYKEIDNNALQNYGFSSLTEVEEETRMLFDTDTAAYILDMMQNPFHYGEIARRYITVEEKTFAYIGEREYLSDDITFCTETLQILSHQKENGIPTVKVSCDVEVQNEDKSVQRRTGETFRFRKENGRWHLSELVSVTYDQNY